MAIGASMPALDFSEANAEPMENDLVEAGRYATSSEAADHGLVVLALGHPYWLVEAADGFRLLIEPDVAAAARSHLAAYDRESSRWPPPPLTDPWSPGKSDLITPLLWGTSVLAIFKATAASPHWLEWGALNSGAVFANQEWWRVVTALFLHADAAHVISNALGGLLVFSGVVSTLGRLRGWGLLLLAAACGNLAVAAANYPGPYSSVGSSTAIFAGVGLLSGRAVRIAWRSTHPHRWRAMFAPFAAGATVLALHGAGGQRVDVGAHLSGFLAGFILGFAVGVFRIRSSGIVAAGGGARCP